ncbi:MAG: hypothetical protein WB689_26855, partial [Xanthobacteraceae bacterium]
PKHRPNSIEKVALREWSIALLIDHALDMLASKHHCASPIRLDAVDPFDAVRTAEIFKDVSLRALGFRGKPLKGGS